MDASKTTQRGSKKATKTAAKPKAAVEVPATPPAYKHSDFDPRSPTIDRTPLAPAAVDPRSPSAQRTPIAATKPINAEFVDPRSPGVQRTPLGETQTNSRTLPRGQSRVKKAIAFDSVATPAGKPLL